MVVYYSYYTLFFSIFKLSRPRTLNYIGQECQSFIVCFLEFVLNCKRCMPNITKSAYALCSTIYPIVASRNTCYYSGNQVFGGVTNWDMSLNGTFFSLWIQKFWSLKSRLVTWLLWCNQLKKSKEILKTFNALMYVKKVVILSQVFRCFKWINTSKHPCHEIIKDEIKKNKKL